MKCKKQAENTQIQFIFAIIQSTCFALIASSGLNTSLSVSLDFSYNMQIRAHAN